MENKENINCNYRMATAVDIDVVYNFIKDLAKYEKQEKEMVASSSCIYEGLFGQSPKAFCVLAENKADGVVGFALSYYTYSTFLGKAGIYIEDLFVKEKARGKGFGKGFFRFLAQKAKDEDCGRIEWSVLDWNEPSIKFYKSLGAVAMDEWTTMRLDKNAIDEIYKEEK